jgi:hypothetical protein
MIASNRSIELSERTVTSVIAATFWIGDGFG